MSCTRLQEELIGFLPIFIRVLDIEQSATGLFFPKSDSEEFVCFDYRYLILTLGESASIWRCLHQTPATPLGEFYSKIWV